MRGCPFGKIPVRVPIEAAAPVITEGSGLSVSGLIQRRATLPAAGFAGRNPRSRGWCFLLSADTGQEGFDSAQGQSCGLRDR